MLTAEEYDKRHKVLRELSVELDNDPVSLGLNSLTKKLAEMQHLRNRIGAALAEAINNKSEVEIEYKRIEHQMEVELSKFMLTDDSVRTQKSQDMREIAAQAKVPNLVLQKHQAEVNLVRADAYMKFAQQIHETLESANTNLSRQISVIQLEVEIKEISFATPVSK